MSELRAAERPVRIGVQLPPQHADYARIRDRVREVEEMGVDIAFNWDHFFPLYGEPDGRHFECWTMLGAWAEQTSRIEIGARGQLLQQLVEADAAEMGGFGAAARWEQVASTRRPHRQPA